MRRTLWIAAGGGVLIVFAAGFLVYIFRTYQFVSPDADSLVKKAIEEPKLEDRLTAAASLSTLDGDAAVVYMNRLVKESKDPEVIVRVIPMLLARKRDSQTADLLFETLNHSDAAVREAAFEGLKSLIKIAPADKASFVPDDPVSKRQAAAKALKEKYEMKDGR